MECDLSRSPPQCIVHMSLLGVRLSTITSVHEDRRIAEKLGASPFEAVRYWEPKEKDKRCQFTGLTLSLLFDRTIRADMNQYIMNDFTNSQGYWRRDGQEIETLNFNSLTPD